MYIRPKAPVFTSSTAPSDRRRTATEGIPGPTPVNPPESIADELGVAAPTWGAAVTGASIGIGRHFRTVRDGGVFIGVN